MHAYFFGMAFSSDLYDQSIPLSAAFSRGSPTYITQKRKKIGHRTWEKHTRLPPRAETTRKTHSNFPIMVFNVVVQARDAGKKQ